MSDDSSTLDLRILHVTEAMGGGVVSLTDSLSRAQAELGCYVSVRFTRRNDTPDLEHLRERFHPRVALEPVGDGKRRLALLDLARSLRSDARRNKFDVIHLHSSIAGGIGRIATLGTGTETRVFYSPHGFAFLRLNTPRAVRALTTVSERVLAQTGNGLILTADSELELARRRLRAPRVSVLQTGVPSSTLRATNRSSLSQAGGHLPTVGMVGRITYQKAPWRFAKVARALAGDARFVWVGDGAQADINHWLGSDVEVTGWLASDELEKVINSFDVLLFPTLWEGMPLSLIQAQAQGVPAVVSDAVGNRDAVSDGVSGFVCSTDSELIERTRALIADPALRSEMSAGAVDWAREKLVDDQIGSDSLSLYGYRAGVFATPTRS